MKILRQTPQQLVVVDSMVPIAVFFALIALFPVFVANSTHDKRAYTPAVVFLLIALFCLRKTTFVFDAMQRTARWRRWRCFLTNSGTIPFDTITDIGTETMPSQRGAPQYRLTVLTPHGRTPMSDGYGGTSKRYEAIRATILAFIRGEQTASDNSDEGLESSVRSLLAQGRKIDAIHFVKARENLTLTQATNRVEEIDQATKTIN